MTTLTSLFAFKSWAQAELLAVMATVDAAQHSAGWTTAVRLLNHIHVVDRIFQGHLAGKPHGHAATNTPETPTLAALAASIAEVDAWYGRYVATLDAAQLAEVIDFTFTDGDAGRMTREEILVHVLAHGGYHRGAIGQVLRSLGTAPPRELYTRFLHSTEPDRRAFAV